MLIVFREKVEGSLGELRRGRHQEDRERDPDAGKDKFVVEAVKIAKKACWRKNQEAPE